MKYRIGPELPRAKRRVVEAWESSFAIYVGYFGLLPDVSSYSGLQINASIPAEHNIGEFAIVMTHIDHAWAGMHPYVSPETCKDAPSAL